MRIDVYDFDGTLYDGDSTADFVLFCLRRHPALLLSLPSVARQALRALTGRGSLTQMKSTLFSRMARRVDLQAEAKRFWQSPKTRQKLGAWFQHTPRDLPIVIASASPEFELQSAADILGVGMLIGTRCAADGSLIGRNCKGEEKLSRIREAVGDFAVRAMYTDDARADAPLLAAAEERYLVTHGTVRRLP